MSGQTVIDELITILAVDVKAGTQPVVQHFTSMLDGVTKSAGFATAGLMATVGALVGSGAAIFDFSLKQAHTAATMERMSKITGINAAELQKWRNVAANAGADADTFLQDIKHLGEAAADYLLPGHYNEGFFRLGIQPFKIVDGVKVPKTGDDVVYEALEKLHKATTAQREVIIKLLGVTDQTQLISLNTLDKIKEWQQKTHLISQEDLDRANEFDKKWSATVEKFRNIKISLGLDVIPAENNIAEFWDNVFKEKKEGEKWEFVIRPEISREASNLFNEQLTKLENRWKVFKDYFKRENPDLIESFKSVFDVIEKSWNKLAEWAGRQAGLTPNPDKKSVPASVPVPSAPGALPISKTPNPDKKSWWYQNSLWESFIAVMSEPMKNKKQHESKSKPMQASASHLAPKTTRKTIPAQLSAAPVPAAKGALPDYSGMRNQWREQALQLILKHPDWDTKKNSPLRPVAHSTIHHSENHAVNNSPVINVHQHITGANSKEIADKSVEGFTQTLQLLYPGGLSPIIG
jgi:hypothetical protein